MTTSGEGPVDPPQKDETWLLRLIEGRRAEVAGFTWSVPGLAIAGQAFLLSIVLDASATPTARIIASLAGVIAAAAATHLYAKQIYLFDLYEAAIERARQHLELPGVQTEELRAEDFPVNTLYVRRGWAKPPNGWRRLFLWSKTAIVWLCALVGFLVIDLFLFLYSLVSLFVDPGWL